jgi:hypothetical protein
MQPDNNQPSNPISGAAPASGSSSMSPDIVNNIPLKAQDSPLTPVSEADDLDKIMRDVSHDLKQGAKKPPKKGFFDFKRQPKAPKTAAPAARPAAPLPPSQPKAALQPKPARQSSAPVLAITMTVIVTGVLIAAAYYAYK